jgi:integrase
MLKNFAFKVYPLDLDVTQRWYLKFEVVDNFGRVRFKKLAVSLKCRTVEARLLEVERLKKVVEAGFDPKPKAQKEPSANRACERLKEELQKAKGELRRKSVSCYRTFIRKFEAYCLEKHIETVTESVAEDFLNYLRENGLSGVTINNYRSVLKSYFKKLRASKTVNKNAFEGTKKRKEVGKTREYFRIHQRKSILEWCENNDKSLVIAIKLIYFCFIRPGNELTGLRVSDVNLDDGILTVRGDISKNGLTERVKIPRQLLPILTALDLHKYPSDYYLLGKNGMPSLIKMSVSGWNERHRVALEAVGIVGKKRQWSIYSWKDAGAIELHKNNVPMRLIQLQLRHKNLSTTSIYFYSFGISDLSELWDAFSDA